MKEKLFIVLLLLKAINRGKVIGIRCCKEEKSDVAKKNRREFPRFETLKSVACSAWLRRPARLCRLRSVAVLFVATYVKVLSTWDSAAGN